MNLLLLTLEEVEKMIKKLTSQELRQIQLEIATLICIKYPSLYRKIFGQAGYVMGEREALAGECLKGICEIDPVIKIILGY